MLRHWPSPVRSLLDLVFQPPCPICRRSASAILCLDCQRQIQACQRSQPCDRPHNLPLFAWGDYRGALKRAIAALKYNDHPEIADYLGREMANRWLAISPVKGAIVVPIPLHPSKLATRGFNQAELLARSFCDRAHLPLAAHGLLRQRETTAQHSLSAQERQSNLQGAFTVSDRWRKKTPSRSVLLLDDIYTTGSTIHAAIQTLRQHQIRVSGIVVLSRTATPS